jgi:hypothetical protein
MFRLHQAACGASVMLRLVFRSFERFDRATGVVSGAATA